MTAAATIVIDHRCTGCGACLVTCPERALERAPGHPRVDDDRCTACLACVEVCPAGAIAESGPAQPGGHPWSVAR